MIWLSTCVFNCLMIGWEEDKSFFFFFFFWEKSKICLILNILCGFLVVYGWCDIQVLTLGLHHLCLMGLAPKKRQNINQLGLHHLCSPTLTETNAAVWISTRIPRFGFGVSNSIEKVSRLKHPTKLEQDNQTRQQTTCRCWSTVKDSPFMQVLPQTHRIVNQLYHIKLQTP